MNRMIPYALALLSVLTACDSIAGLGDPWTVSGQGNDVIDRPRSVERVRVTGSFSGELQNFVAWCGDIDLVVNEILGTRSQGGTQYSGTHLLEPGCNPIRITNSNGVARTFTEVR